ncbi:cold-regulated protein 28-like [Vigna umbellata]|uniref:cold-regulated protein 28-like n=1 Tax=Vigna umbellata TaxID=87088 RepID=UPI001F5F015E|nr:cold-regulated protein 28-like [Vigna umbellata]
MTWHTNDCTDTCKSEAMWNLFPSPHTSSLPLNRTQRVSSPLKLRSRFMEPQDLPRHLSPPLFSDPEPLPEYLTRSTSDSSAVTVEDTSKDFSSHSAPAPLLDQSTRWTDQQHSLYIRSLEASFVNELHRSMRLRRWSIKNSTDEACQYRILRNSHNMPKQTLALQDACQKRINLERISPLFESTADSHILTGSQFELASVDRGCSLEEPINCKHGLFCDQEIHARGSSTLELAFSTTEVTDQNFKDEEAKSSCMPLVKRLKKAAADGSSSDQSVPFGKLHTPDVSISSNGTSENRGHELLSELPESISQSLICRTFLWELREYATH